MAAEKKALGWMALWHDLVWKAESTTITDTGEIRRGRVERVEDMSIDYSLKSYKVKTKKTENGREKVVESILETNDVSFETTYKVAAGTLDINAKILEIKDMIGYAAPLIIANFDSPMVWGSFYMQLTAVSTSNVEMDEVGRIREATVRFTLTETRDKKVMKQAMQNPGDSTNVIIEEWKSREDIPNEYMSALKICPDPEIKAILKRKRKRGR